MPTAANALFCFICHSIFIHVNDLDNYTLQARALRISDDGSRCTAQTVRQASKFDATIFHSPLARELRIDLRHLRNERSSSHYQTQAAISVSEYLEYRFAQVDSSNERTAASRLTSRGSPLVLLNCTALILLVDVLSLGVYPGRLGRIFPNFHSHIMFMQPR